MFARRDRDILGKQSVRAVLNDSVADLLPDQFG